MKQPNEFLNFRASPEGSDARAHSPQASPNRAVVDAERGDMKVGEHLKQIKTEVEVQGIEQFSRMEELKSFLEVHWHEINDICMDIQTRAGVVATKNIPKIICVEKLQDTSLAQYDPSTPDRVYFNSSFLSESADTAESQAHSHDETESGGDDPFSVREPHPIAPLVSTFIHESLHAISYHTVITSGDGNTEFDYIGLRKGSIERDNNAWKKEGEYLNEAVTEHLAQVVMYEFMKRSGTKSGLNVQEEWLREGRSYESNLDAVYEDARIQMYDLIASAAKSNNITPETLWQAFTRQYLTGEHSYDTFIQSMHELSGVEKNYFPETDGRSRLQPQQREEYFLNFINHLLHSADIMDPYTDRTLEKAHRDIASGALRVDQ